MSIQTKIEEIRRKPEHIRLRYVWGATAVSMVFVLLIWGVSLSVQKKDFQKNTLGIDDTTLETISTQKDDLQNTAQNIKNSMDKAKEMDTSGDNYQKMLENTYSQPETDTIEEYPTDSFDPTDQDSTVQNLPSTSSESVPPTNTTPTTNPPTTKIPPTTPPANSITPAQ